MSTLDPETAHRTMAPNLSTADRLEYVRQEQDFIRELLEDTDDCKWIYQGLMELAFLESRLHAIPLSEEQQSEVMTWLERLKALDPLRKGRWDDVMSSHSQPVTAS
jgi:geranylgeranyl transferase type-2 subunit alpha